MLFRSGPVFATVSLSAPQSREVRRLSKDNAKGVQADGTSNDERSNRWKLWDPRVLSGGSRDIECLDVKEIREKSRGGVMECSILIQSEMKCGDSRVVWESGSRLLTGEQALVASNGQERCIQDFHFST